MKEPEGSQDGTERVQVTVDCVQSERDVMDLDSIAPWIVQILQMDAFPGVRLWRKETEMSKLNAYFHLKKGLKEYIVVKETRLDLHQFCN